MKLPFAATLLLFLALCLCTATQAQVPSCARLDYANSRWPLKGFMYYCGTKNPPSSDPDMLIVSNAANHNHHFSQAEVRGQRS
jgi:hypothetical protein